MTNFASMGVMKNLGFSYERDIEKAGFPHVFYRLTRESCSTSDWGEFFTVVACTLAGARSSRLPERAIHAGEAAVAHLLRLSGEKA